jgi:hypothetical protein
MKTYIQLITILIVANSYAQNPVPFDIIYTQRITATKPHLGQYGKVTLEKLYLNYQHGMQFRDINPLELQRI